MYHQKEIENLILLKAVRKLITKNAFKQEP